MLNITTLSNNLELHEGIWRAKSDREVSYHDEGHANCYQVESNSFWFIHRNECIKTLLQNYPAPNDTLFDVGGGNGFVTKSIESIGVDSFLVEPGINGVKNARARGVKNIIHASLQDTGFKAGTIPSIGLFDVIEHIEDDKGLIKDIYDFVQPDGRLYITVPTHNWLWSYHDVNAGHYRRYTKKSISQLVENAGFKVEYATYFFSALVAPNFILRSIPTRLGLRKNIDDLKVKKSHHINSESTFNKILNTVWRKELRKIGQSKQISIGNSCILVAKK